MKKKVLNLMIGATIISVITGASTNVLATPTNTPSKIINSEGQNKEEHKIPVEGSIGAWNDDTNKRVDIKDKPEVAQLSVTAPTKLVFTVVTNAKDGKEKGKFISPEYKITNNGASSNAVKVTLESVTKKASDTNTLELGTVSENNGKVEIDLGLKLGDSGQLVKVKESSSVENLGEIAKGKSEKLQLEASSWEVPTQELKNGTEKVESNHELILGFELKK